MPIISREEAHGLLRHSRKRAHSLLVSRIMRFLAEKFGGDRDEWELVGLLHDIDYDQVQGDMTKHGMVASKILRGKLPERSLRAIRTHDHRTGLEPKTTLDRSLIFADSLAILLEDQGIDSCSDASGLQEALEKETASKPWIAMNIVQYANQNEVSFSCLWRWLHVAEDR